MNAPRTSTTGGRPGLTQAGWFLVVLMMLTTLAATYRQRPNLDTDVGTCLLAAEQYRLGVSDRFHQLVAVNPDDLASPPAAKQITWWPSAYTIPLWLGRTIGLDWGQATQLSFIFFWLVGTVGWLLLFKQLVRPHLLPWILLAALAFRSTHAAGYLYEGGELMYWSLLPFCLLLNQAALDAPQQPGQSLKLPLLAGLLTPCLVMIKYSAGISALAIGLCWLLLLRIGKVQLPRLGCWAAGAGVATGLILLSGQLPDGNPASGSGSWQWSVLAWIPGAWTFAFSDLESLVRFIAVHPDRAWLPAVGCYGDGHIAFLSPLTLGLVAWLWICSRNSQQPVPLRAGERGPDTIVILVVAHLVLASLLLGILILGGGAIHMDSRFLRPAALAILPLLVAQAAGSINSSSRCSRYAAASFLLLLVLLPAAYGKATLIQKMLIRGRTAANQVGPAGIRHDLLSANGDARQFYRELGAALDKETVVYVIDPAMAVALADQWLLIEHAHLRPLDFLAEKRYQGQPAGGVLIAVPSSFLANGKLAAIQQSFVDISGWQQLPTESKVDWVLSRSR